jgi:hypothetical protein
LRDLKDLNASDADKAKFLGIDEDEYKTLINDPEILNKLDELIENSKGFKIEIGKEL